MPTYTYVCNCCGDKFELFFSIKEYIEKPKCVSCEKKDTYRSYSDDIPTTRGSVIKNDNELKTLGDLANRNRDKMKDDQKQELYHKHNEYKEQTSQKNLPKGMNRIKKSKKIKWT